VFLIHNEQTKHTAAWLNALATALMAAGFFAPSAALLYGLSQVPIGSWAVGILAFGCVVAGVALHLLGRIALRRLRE